MDAVSEPRTALGGRRFECVVGDIAAGVRGAVKLHAVSPVGHTMGTSVERGDGYCRRD